MVKKSSSKVRGVLIETVKKHKIRSKAAARDKASGADLIDFETGFAFGKLKYSKLFRWGHQWFHHVTDQSAKLGLVPFERIYGNTFVRLPRKKLPFHYATVFVLTCAMVCKLCATIKFASGQDVLTIETFMCISVSLCSVIPWSMSLVTVSCPDESLTLLNIWTDYLKCAGIKSGNLVNSTSLALQLINYVLFCHASAIVVTVAGLIFSTLPVCMFPAVENMGLLPDLPVPRIVWQLVFFPLELFLNMVSIYHSALSGHMMCIGVSTHAVGLFEMRKRRVTGLIDRLKLEQMYIQLVIYNRAFANWLRIMIAPTAFTGSCAIVITMYVTIRHTEIPWYFYAGFPYVGFTMLVIWLWISYTAINNIRDSEAILGKLQSLSTRELAALSLRQRKQAVKKAKSFRPLEFPFGPFVDMTFSVPVAMWEEMLSQLVFLLTLQP